MIKNFPFRKPHSDISYIKELEMRLLQMEAVMHEMRAELEAVKSKVTEEDIQKIEKMYAYQRAFDDLLKTPNKCVLAAI